jgi:Kef-type K+ transport system membrane component KefB
MVPFLFWGVLAWSLYPRLGNGAPRLPFVLFLGAAMGITAFPVLARILADRRLMHTRVGMFALACAAFDDLTAWCLLAIITVIARPATNQNQLSWHFVALMAYILAMVFLVRPALHRLLPASAKPSFAQFGLRTSIALLNSVELWFFCGLIVMVAVGSNLLVGG